MSNNLYELNTEEHTLLMSALVNEMAMATAEEFTKLYELLLTLSKPVVPHDWEPLDKEATVNVAIDGGDRSRAVIGNTTYGMGLAIYSDDLRHGQQFVFIESGTSIQVCRKIDKRQPQ